MNSKGTSLVTVLWIIAVISIVSFTLAASVRVEVASEMDSIDSERAFYMAKGAAETVFYAQSAKVEISGEHSPVRFEKGIYRFPFSGGEAQVRMEGAANRIDINSASDRLLASLFDSVGVDHETRNSLVDSVLDWRDPDDIRHLYGAEVGDYDQPKGESGLKLPANGPFGAIDDLLLVKNMTPDVFYGRFISVNGEYRRVPGLRELIALEGGERVNVNAASADVLLALPDMLPDVAKKIVELRGERFFDNAEDLTRRIPDLTNSEALKYIRFDSAQVDVIVSTATIAASNTSRSVRVVFSRDQKIQYLSFVPFVYRRTDEMKFGRWRYQ